MPDTLLNVMKRETQAHAGKASHLVNPDVAYNPTAMNMAIGSVGWAMDAMNMPAPTYYRAEEYKPDEKKGTPVIDLYFPADASAGDIATTLRKHGLSANGKNNSTTVAGVEYSVVSLFGTPQEISLSATKAAFAAKPLLVNNQTTSDPDITKAAIKELQTELGRF